MRFGPWEIALVLVIILIVFGVGKLPQVGEAIGKSIRSFKKAQSGDDEERVKAAPNAKETSEKKAG
ncbi:MAG: preprotein translocase subunit TatA [Chloroflexi bacterium RBG_16_56_11]|nr:MAG: preprotein translocase subunit TatA [Chloroflexi bacterium RBG_16_56_11]